MCFNASCLVEFVKNLSESRIEKRSPQQDASDRVVASKNSVDGGYQSARIAHWGSIARAFPDGSRAGKEYHRRLAEVYATVITPGQRVLELGCGTGDLLASVRPTLGVGVDFSSEMIALARVRHPELTFIQADVHDLSALEETFDVLILSDLVNDVYDVQAALLQARRVCKPNARVIINIHSYLWEIPLKASAALGLATPRLEQNWLTLGDFKGLLQLAGFEVIRDWQEVLLPLPIPGLRSIANRYLVKILPFRWLALTNFVLAGPAGQPAQAKPLVSVIVPARNEEGNIAEIFSRVPEMGAGTEIIFVEGGSRDDTYAAIERSIDANPHRRCKVFRQTGKGKGDAVRLGYANASGGILMILDADLTVRPEDLPRFVDVLVSGQGEFVNGVRLVYPMEDEAMRFFNLVGNKFFSLAFSWLLGQTVKDTLCGTKVLWKRDYERIAANRAYFGDFDPFGDFDLLFGASKLGLKIVEMPIRYQARKYGTTNIQRWRHGVLLLRMVLFAARRMKFV
jgi:SAM-dependent methyltransferase